MPKNGFHRTKQHQYHARAAVQSVQVGKYRQAREKLALEEMRHDPHHCECGKSKRPSEHWCRQCTMGEEAWELQFETEMAMLDSLRETHEQFWDRWDQAELDSPTDDDIAADWEWWAASINDYQGYNDPMDYYDAHPIHDHSI